MGLETLEAFEAASDVVFDVVRRTARAGFGRDIRGFLESINLDGRTIREALDIVEAMKAKATVEGWLSEFEDTVTDVFDEAHYEHEAEQAGVDAAIKASKG